MRNARTFIPKRSPPGPLFCAGAAICLIAGCSAPPPRAVLEPPAPTTVGDQHVSVEYGRYARVDTAPEIDQQDLLMQIVDVTIPASVMPTVGNALRYVLLRSGYQLCAERTEVLAIDTLPLPAAHMRLGPLKLRDALQLLVGPAWSLETDDEARLICLFRRSERPDQADAESNRQLTTPDHSTWSSSGTEREPKQ